MGKTAKELFKEKLALIYEYNKLSPLFVRAAELEIHNNNLNKALDIILRGLKNNPNYPTAHFVLGNIFALSGNFEKAEESYIKGSELISSKKTLEYYITELEKIKRTESHFTESRQVAFFQKEVEEPVPAASAWKTEEPKTSGAGNKIENNLEVLAKEISSAKITANNTSEEKWEQLSTYNDNAKEPEIISDTMANIYITQGKFKEAVEIYKKLLIKNPSRHLFYKERINYIESQIEDSAW